MNNLEITRMETVNKALVFYAGDKRYQIPSRMFPIAKRAQIVGFQPKNTVEYDDGTIKGVIDSLGDFPVGYCYTNTEKLVAALKAAGYDAEFYAGWVFIGPYMPTHHAWAVLRHEGGASIVDTMKFNLIRRVEESSPPDKSNPEWRAVFAKHLARMDEVLPLHEKIIIGKAPETFFYVGSPDNAECARELYIRAIQLYPDHPAYREEGASALGYSWLQSEIAHALPPYCSMG